LKRILFLLIIISLTPGCLIIPLPSDHGEEIDKVLKQIAIGKTTREEVISILGRPTVTTDRYISYFKKEYDGGVGVMVFIPPIGGWEAGQVFMDLYFEFDNYGVLVDFRMGKY